MRDAKAGSVPRPTIQAWASATPPAKSPITSPADVDAERDRLVEELQQAEVVQSVQWLDGFHETLEGHNGGGDPWRTDGRLAIVSLRSSK